MNKSAGCCLQKCALILKNEIMAPIVAFVSENIVQPDWKLRYASLMALGAISDGPDKVKFAEVIVPSLDQLMAMFVDPAFKVRYAIGWVFN